MGWPVFKGLMFGICCGVASGWAPVNAAEKSQSHSHPVLANECVILLHGLGRTRSAMQPLEKRLSAAGYFIWNESYPSRKQSIAQSAEHIAKGLAACQVQGAQTTHFVTHSLGGILVRVYFQQHALNQIGRIVMLAPPSQGSEVASLLRDWWLFRWLMGEAGQQLHTDADSLPNRLKPLPEVAIGVIAGRRSADPWFSPFIPGADDGKISVARTRLAEMSDFLEVEAGHTFIMYKQQVIEQTLHFLQHGRFDHHLDDTP